MNASAIGIDLLGEMSKPLIGQAKDKASGVLRFVWLQPYGGYGFGNYSFTTASSGLVTSETTGLSVEGGMFGARGGLQLGPNARLGVDYTKQFAMRTVPSSAVAAPKEKVSNTMLGVGLGVDIPRTPLQAYGARYFTANFEAQGTNSGSGWGYGISFVLVNPFIMLAEYRTLSYASAVSSTNGQNLESVKQVFLNLSFMLL